MKDDKYIANKKLKRIPLFIQETTEALLTTFIADITNIQWNINVIDDKLVNLKITLVDIEYYDKVLDTKIVEHQIEIDKLDDWDYIKYQKLLIDSKIGNIFTD